jgi:hypothetical protein
MVLNANVILVLLAIFAKLRLTTVIQILVKTEALVKTMRTTLHVFALNFFKEKSAMKVILKVMLF